ncbi:MAG: hypothetical protein LAO04_16615 [Acidobacteriia bacterium]|nr:hypothetical protein [Terriglobia bacterium]
MTNCLDDLPDLEDGDESPEDRMMKTIAKIQEERKQYPLKLTPTECLKLMHTDRPQYLRHMRNSKETELCCIYDSELWTPEVEKTVLAGGTCPVCKGRGLSKGVVHGKDTNFYFFEEYRCDCVAAKEVKKLADSKLPEILRDFDLRTLGVSGRSSLLPAKQQAEIAFMRQHPNDSYFFLGPPGTSKSTYSAALFNAALRRNYSGRSTWLSVGDSAWRVDGNHLLKTEVEYATSDDKDSVRRDITSEEIFRARRAGYKPVLLLEEIDKRKPTEFFANVLFCLVNAMDECGGQLLLTTNQTRKGFEDLFLKSDIEQVQVTGGALLRRLLRSPEKVNVRDYHAA